MNFSGFPRDRAAVASWLLAIAHVATVVPGRWREFGQQVLAAHHRNGLGAQCICGSLMYHCPVIAAAEQLGLPTMIPVVAPLTFL